MKNRKPNQRQSQRVILRDPIAATLDEQPAIVLELGTSGVKAEHRERIAVGRSLRLSLPKTTVKAAVRYCTIVPSAAGVLYHSGLEFIELTPQQHTAIYDVLLQEAERQVQEWEANLGGVAGPPRPAFRNRSAIIRRYLWLHLTSKGWERTVTSDPNQPLDGLSVPDDTSQEEIELLCATYEPGDQRMRTYLRTCAMLLILERMKRQK